MKQQLSQQVLQEHKVNSNEISTEAPEAVPFLEMFRFCKKKNLIYMIAGSTCSVIIGGGIPFFSFLWGNMTDAFKNADEMVNQALYIFIQYLLFGVIAIFAGWGMQYFWTVAGEDQANQCRKAYIDSLMRQEVGWFQTQQSSQIVSKFVADTLAFQLAIGQKVSLMIYLFSMFVSGFIISVTRGWELTLVVLAFLPALVYTFYLIEHYNMTKSTFYEKIFQISSGSAESALSSIKTVKQFNGQAHEQKRFEDQVNRLSSQSSSFNFKMSLSYGLSLFCFTFSFTLAYWYGSQCVQGTSNCPRPKANLYTGGTVLTIFFGLILPAMNLNQLAPSLKVITEGRVAAARIYKIIDRVPLVQSPQQPKRIEVLKGVFKFQAVSFAYPKDKQRTVLQGLDMILDCRQSGIMGESGCGKSTLLQLMMRLYDPDTGTVTLDGVDLRQLDLHWLRSQIGYVGQQPLLFSTSIRENLCVGHPAATEAEITKALKQAEAYEFISGLSEGVDTFVGAGGNLLSGGQKQRVAIARALIKNPHIFLLDEATSALDRRNERHIHSTLGLVSSDKVSITVAHSLQAILACDQVYFIEQGKLSMQGKPDEMPAFDDMPLRMSMNSGPSIHSMKKISSKRLIEEAGLYSSNKINIHHQQKLGEEVKETSTYSRLLAYASGNKLLVSVGLISAMLHGLVIPSMGIHVARVLSFNLMLIKDHDHYSNLIRTQCLIMLITCLVAPFTVGLQYFCFLHLGNNIVDKIRQETYSKVLRLPLSWFQDQNTHAEQVPIMLGAGIYTMYHVVTRYFAHLTVAISSIIFGLLLAFYFEWRTALVSIVLIPLIGVAGLFQSKMISGYLVESQQLYEESSKILSQTINNLKTVLSFCYQGQTMQKYSKMLDQIQQKQHTKKLLTGLFFGISLFVLFMVYGLIFYLSSLFIRDSGLQITNAFSAVFLVLFSGIIAGNNAKHIPDLGLLKVTADKLLALIDLEDEDQLQIKHQSKLINREIKGNIEFKNVSFTYSSRQEKALKNVSFKIEEGDRVGLVGESGCGKSTILKLLLGFYQCQEGEILIDGEKIEDYDVYCLRKYFGAVSQEPELFDETVQYNIAYNPQDFSKRQLHESLVKANLVNTDSAAEAEKISESATFLARRVGPHGSHLSGGQKQRVAIARAILRDPKILLLDEATSALDHENEEKVQATLESAMHGKTTLNVTHKLSSLNTATKILVFREGELVESGIYEQLVRKKGTFYRLLK